MFGNAAAVDGSSPRLQNLAAGNDELQNTSVIEHQQQQSN